MLDGERKTQRLLRSPFWLPKEWDLALHRRKAAALPEPGLPADTGARRFEFALPAKAQPVALPGVSENTSAAVALEGRMGEGQAMTS